MDNGLKVTVIGGGSVHTPDLVHGFARQKSNLPIQKLTLMDADAARLQVVGSLATAIAIEALPGCEVVLTDDRHRAIREADFIICQMRVGGLEARRRDEAIAASMGLVGDEVTGASGLALALRTIPAMIDIAKEMEAVNSTAWLVSSVSPAGPVSEAIRRASQIRHLAISEEPLIMREVVACLVGTTPTRLSMDYFGLGHLGFARRVFFRGSDILPALRQRLQVTPAEQVQAMLGKELTNDPKVHGEIVNMLRTLTDTGTLPSPRLQYYYYRKEVLEAQKTAEKTWAELVMDFEDELFKQYGDASIGQKVVARSHGGRRRADMIAGLVGAIAGDTKEVHIVNVPNNGALPELPQDKVVEVPAVVDSSGARPLAVGKMPLPVRGLVQMVAAYEELLVEAAISGSRRDILDALTCHPLIGSREEARSLMDAYLDAHEDFLPQFRR